MTDKIPCKECNELILPKTAEKTGGICMPCKQGRRQSMDQAKKIYQKRKEYNPYRELSRHLHNKVYAIENGFESLTKEEKLYFSVGSFDSQVYGDGIEQFFSSYAGELFYEVVKGLTILKANNSLLLLRQAAMILFGDVAPTKDKLQQYDAMKQYPPYDSEPQPEWARKLDEIDRQYYEDPDNLDELMTNYAEVTGLIQPFNTGTKQM